MRIGNITLPSMFAVHGAAGLVGLAVVVLLVRGVFITETVKSCRERYEAGTVYGLETGRGLLSPGELQAGLAGRDFGVMENLDIVKFENAPSRSGLRVRLAALAANSTTDTRIDNGIDFGWTPKRMPNLTTACLSYSVRVPADFKPGDGGRLPSLVGSPADAASDTRTVSAQLQWTPTGALGLDISAEPAGDGSISATAVNSDAVLPAGSWARIDQEIVLNTPGQEDGSIKVWVNGTLKMRRDELAFRSNPKTVLNGVAITVAYAGSRAETTAEKPGTIDVSTFEIRWP